MTIQQFAEVYSLQTHKDGSGDLIVVGKSLVKEGRTDSPRHREQAHHIFDGYSSGLGVYFNCATFRHWNSIRQKLINAGAAVRQNGDVDGIVQFDPENKKLAKLILKLTGARAKRQLSPEQKQVLADRLARAREEKNAA